MFYLYDNVYHLGVYNPKNLGNDKIANCGLEGVYNPKNLGNDKIGKTLNNAKDGAYNPKNLGNDKMMVNRLIL